MTRAIPGSAFDASRAQAGSLASELAKVKQVCMDFFLSSS